MALPQYNTEQLIENIKRRCSVPLSQLTFTASDFVDLANDELQGIVVPLIMSAREEYFVTFKDYSSPVNGYLALPSQAVGGKVRSVVWVQQTNPLIIMNVPRIDLDVVAGIGVGMGFSWTRPYSYGFYIQGNDLVLYPTNTVPTGTQFRIYYYKRSLVLAPPTEYGQIVSIDSGSNTIQLSQVPTDWAVGTRLNAVSSLPGFDITSELTTITAISSPSIVVDNIAGLSVGDYVSMEGYSAIPQVPVEAHAWLAQLTAAKALEGLGDREGMQAAQMEAEKLKTAMLVMVSQRVDGSIKKIINPSGGLRQRASGWRYGYRGY